MGGFGETRGLKRIALALAAALAFCSIMPGTAAIAQVQQIDPNDAIDADLDNPAPPAQPDYGTPDTTRYDDGVPTDGVPPATGEAAPTLEYEQPAADAGANTSYQKDDLIGAAEGVFGKGAEGLAGIIEDILRDQGEPNGYIVGREASGAFVVGLRYGSGTLHHKVEGELPVYWTGPSVGFDAGGNAGSTFVLVYNLYDSEDLYRRYPAGEGAAYLVGGFNSSYLRRGDVVLIPVRLGVGLRLGANVGYMKFSKKRRLLPF